MHFKINWKYVLSTLFIVMMVDLQTALSVGPLFSQPIPLSTETPYIHPLEPKEHLDSSQNDNEPDSAQESDISSDQVNVHEGDISTDLIWETTGLGSSVERSIQLILDSPVIWERPDPHVITETGRALGDSHSAMIGQAYSMDAQARIRGVEAMLLRVAEENQPLPDELLWALADSNESVRTTAASGIQNLPPAVMGPAAQQRLSEYVLSVFTSMDANLIAPVDDILPYLRRWLTQSMTTTLENNAEVLMRRRAAAYTLGRMKVEEAAELLVRGVWADDPLLSWSCAEGLHMLESTAVLGDWINILQHQQDSIRVLAVSALGRIGGHEALRALRAILFGEIESDYNMQLQALQAITNYSQREAVPILIEVLEQSPRLRTTAANLLRQITNQDIGDHHDDWRQWYQQF